MQILKESVRDRIQGSAVRLFAKRGFRDTSMRMIAKEAGITAGNIYRYFDTKEQILDGAVAPLIQHVENLISDHEHEVSAADPDAPKLYHELIAVSIVDIYQRYRQEYTILLRMAAGTAYEGYHSTLVSQIADKMRYFCTQHQGPGPFRNPEIYEILAQNHVSAIIFALENVQDPARKQQVIREYLDLQFMLIQDPQKAGDN